MLRYTDELGGELYAAELYNEPNAPEPDWDAEPHTAGEYARDFAVFSAFMADEPFQKYGVLRDQHAPDAPIWLTETGAASCGGTRWQPTFLDTFRYLDTQARLARQGLDAIFTHALISGSNGIIDEQSFTPNASYWAALLWRRLMGAEVLNADAHQQPGLQIYAHCHPTKTGGVTVLVLNLDKDILPLEMAAPQERHSLTAPQLDSTMVLLNGTPLALTADDHLPDLAPIISIDDTIELAPHSVNFIVLPNAGNQYCAL